MNAVLPVAAFAAGLLAVAWVGAGYAGTNPLALVMTALIGAFYVAGAVELRRFQQATARLSQALAELPATLPDLTSWLDQLPPALRQPVRARIEGERAALPGPALVPYLVGLLVLLGMLGTFLGMVVTLKGTVSALEGSADLQAMRASLAAPVKGLGLAFGTSVAGVAASAMLGLVAALCRRERLQVAQRLDSRIATVLRPFSLAHQRQEAMHALQLQAQALPAVLNQLQALMQKMDQRTEALNDRLVASQEAFFRHTEAVHATLAASVDQSLRTSLAESARIAGATIQPVVQATMNGIAQETTQLQAHLAGTVQQQLQAMAAQLGATVDAVSQRWQHALDEHQQQAARLAEQSQAALAARDEQRLAAWTEQLAGMATLLQREWQQAGAHTLGQQQQICAALERSAHDIGTQAQAHAQRTIAEVTRLMQAASEAPRAAAEVIGQLRQQLSDSMVRDNAMLDERARLLATLGGLLDAVNHAATQQRGAIDALVASSAALLDRVGTQLTGTIEAESTRLSTAAAQVGASVVEVASLGDAFGAAVMSFGDTNAKLMEQLQRIEAALGQSVTRSDDQLAWCVAQARELIDLSVLSQKQIVDELRQVGDRVAQAAGAAA